MNDASLQDEQTEFYNTLNDWAANAGQDVDKAYIEIGDRIAPELSFCRLDLIDWWALRRSQYGKQAVGTEQAWTTSQNALLAILRVHGAQVVTDTVQAGLANAWRSFRESYAVLPKPATPAQQQAGKVTDWDKYDNVSFFK